MSTIKTINGLAIASMKSRNGVAVASIKTIGGVDVPAGGASPFGGAVSTTSLVDWWPLSETSGTRAGVHASLDMTDNNTVTGSSSGGPDGTSAYSQFTRANSEYLSRASEAALQTGDIDFTISVWAYLDSKPVTSATMNLVTKYETASPSNAVEYWLGHETTADRFSFRVSSDGTGTPAGTVFADNLGAPSLSTWYHVVCWHDSVGNTINLKVNDGTTDTVAYSAGIIAGGAPFRFGVTQLSFNRYWDGRMQRIGFWKRVLTGSEITALYNSGNGLDY